MNNQRKKLDSYGTIEISIDFIGDEENLKEVSKKFYQDIKEDSFLEIEQYTDEIVNGKMKIYLTGTVEADSNEFEEYGLYPYSEQEFSKFVDSLCDEFNVTCEDGFYTGDLHFYVFAYNSSHYKEDFSHWDSRREIDWNRNA